MWRARSQEGRALRCVRSGTLASQTCALCSLVLAWLVGKQEQYQVAAVEGGECLQCFTCGPQNTPDSRFAAPSPGEGSEAGGELSPGTRGGAERTRPELRSARPARPGRALCPPQRSCPHAASTTRSCSSEGSGFGGFFISLACVPLSKADFQLQLSLPFAPILFSPY